MLEASLEHMMYARAFHAVMVKADIVNLRLICAVCRHEHGSAEYISAVDDRAAAGVEVL